GPQATSAPAPPSRQLGGTTHRPTARSLHHPAQPTGRQCPSPLHPSTTSPTHRVASGEHSIGLPPPPPTPAPPSPPPPTPAPPSPPPPSPAPPSPPPPTPAPPTPAPPTPAPPTPAPPTPAPPSPPTPAP